MASVPHFVQLVLRNSVVPRFGGRLRLGACNTCNLYTQCVALVTGCLLCALPRFTSRVLKTCVSGAAKLEVYQERCSSGGSGVAVG